MTQSQRQGEPRMDKNQPDVRKRGVIFLTIICDSSREVVIHNRLPWERLSRHADYGQPDLVRSYRRNN